MQTDGALLKAGTGWRNLDVPTVVMFVTDGEATDPTATGNQIRNLNNRFNTTLMRFAVGVGTYSYEQLFMLANNQTDGVRELGSFLGLASAQFLHLGSHAFSRLDSGAGP